MKITRSLRAIMAGTGLAVGALTLVAGGGTAFATGPSIHVSPYTGLTNNEVVTVKGSHFSIPSGDLLVVTECNKGVAVHDTGSCNQNPALEGQPGQPLIYNGSLTRRGGFSTSYTVATGTVGDGSCGISRATEVCYITAAVVNPNNPNPPYEYAAFKVHFVR